MGYRHMGCNMKYKYIEYRRMDLRLISIPFRQTINDKTFKSNCFI